MLREENSTVEPVKTRKAALRRHARMVSNSLSCAFIRCSPRASSSETPVTTDSVLFGAFGSCTFSIALLYMIRLALERSSFYKLSIFVVNSSSNVEPTIRALSCRLAYPERRLQMVVG